MRFLVCCWLLTPGGLAPAVGVAADASCAADTLDASAEVEFVIDGDTVKLRDGRHVRLLGINTPEIGRDGRPSQPLAERARQRLIDLIGSGGRVGLRFDQERHDKYGRILAHVYDAQRRSLGAALLSEGLATQLVVPPNELNVGCFAALERSARVARVGLWALPQYQAIPSTSLEKSADGYYIVKGRVERVAHTARSVWIDLEGGVGLRIDTADLRYFSGMDLDALRGRHVEARGWIHPNRGRLRMQVRHPAALDVVA